MVENDKEGCVLAESRHSLSKVHFSTVQCTIKEGQGSRSLRDARSLLKVENPSIISAV